MGVAAGDDCDVAAVENAAGINAPRAFSELK